MALTKKDLQQIQDLLTHQLTHERQYLRVALDQHTQDIKRDIRDEMDAQFSAFENKIGKIFEGVYREFLQEIRAVACLFPHVFRNNEKQF